MALHAWDAGEAGFSLFDAWSQGGVKYEEGCTIEKWRSFTQPPPLPPGVQSDGHVRQGTVYHYAEQAGWTYPKADRSTSPPRPTPATIGTLPAGSLPGGSTRSPQITIDRQTSAIVADAWYALLARNDLAIIQASAQPTSTAKPSKSATVTSIDAAKTSASPDASKSQTPTDADDHPLFLRGGRLTRCAWKSSITNEEPILHLETLTQDQTRNVLCHIADWVILNDTGIHNKRLPMDVLKIIHADPGYCGGSSLPPIESIVHTPVFDTDGTLIATPGYHRQARLWLQPTRDLQSFPSVPREPSPTELAEAKSLLLDDLLIDFPFTGDPERAHALAAILLPFVRRLIPGPTPLHLIEAPTPGTGKSLLADVVNLIATGHRAEPITIGRGDEEIEKKVVATLMRGRPVVLIDNINYALSSGSLASALTAYPCFTGRRLGASEIVELPNYAVWLATANNPRITMEIARRCARIRIDAPTERPWERTRFKHTPLQGWITRNRAALVHACLTLVRTWQAAGAPRRRSTPLGSFEEWSGVLGGILDAIGIPGFLGNMKELYETADDQSSQFKELVAAWWSDRSDRETTVAELVDLCEREGILTSIRGDGSARSQQIRLGKKLGFIRDRVVDGKKIVVGKTRKRSANCYRLVEVENGNSSENGQESAFETTSSKGVEGVQEVLDLRNFK